MSAISKSLFAALVLTSTMPPALAQAPTDAPSVRVAYGDLNLSSPAGVHTLLNRMKSAADTVCGSRPSPRQLGAVLRYKTCKQDAMSRAVAAIDSPLLTATFTGKTAGEKIAAR